MGKHCFSLIRYGFCRGNALYSASLSVRMCIFLFDSFWCLRLLLFRIKSQPGVAYKSVVYKKKHVSLIFSLLKMKKWLCPMSLFLCLSSISMRQHCRKSLVQSKGAGVGGWKKYKKWGWPYGKGIVYRRGHSNLLHIMLTLGWPLGLHNTSWHAKFKVQNFSFCW